MIGRLPARQFPEFEFLKFAGRRLGHAVDNDQFFGQVLFGQVSALQVIRHLS